MHHFLPCVAASIVGAEAIVGGEIRLRILYLVLPSIQPILYYTRYCMKHIFALHQPKYKKSTEPPLLLRLPDMKRKYFKGILELRCSHHPGLYMFAHWFHLVLVLSFYPKFISGFKLQTECISNFTKWTGLNYSSYILEHVCYLNYMLLMHYTMSLWRFPNYKVTSRRLLDIVHLYSTSIKDSCQWLNLTFWLFIIWTIRTTRITRSTRTTRTARTVRTTRSTRTTR